MYSFISIKNQTNKNQDNVTLYDTKSLPHHEDWQYKMYIIKLHLNKINSNEVLVYCHNTKYIDKLKENIDDIFSKINNNIIIPIENPTLLLNRVAHNNIFTILGNNSNYYKYAYLLNTDFIFIRKTEESVNLINTIYNYEKHYNVLGKIKKKSKTINNTNNNTINNTNNEIITSFLYQKYMGNEMGCINLHIINQNDSLQFNYINKMPLVNSFDIFDTIVTRNVLNPTDIYDIIEREYPFPKFKEYRILAESKNGQTLDSIYNEFKIISGIEDSEIEKLKEFEIQTEINNLFLIRSNYNLIRDNDILVSDMYFNPEQLEYILKSIGYHKNTKIYSSSCGMSKIKETMYKYLQTKYIIMTHTGDNMHSDILNSDKHNINSRLTLIHRPIKVEEFFIKNNYKEFALLLRRFRLMNPYFLNSLKSKLYNEQALYNIPLLVLISMALNNIMVKENRDTLLCLTRDGCLLYNIFKLMYPHHNCKIFYSSRKLHTNYNDEYIEYIKSNYDHSKCIMFDGHGSFKSGRDLYNKVFNCLPRIYVYTYNATADEYDGFSYGCTSHNDFEHINSDIAGSIIEMKDGQIIRDELEYDVNDAMIYHNTINNFCDYIKNNNIIINEMPLELLKQFSDMFSISSSINYRTKQEGVPMLQFLKDNNIDPVEWVKSKSVV